MLIMFSLLIVVLKAGLHILCKNSSSPAAMICVLLLNAFYTAIKNVFKDCPPVT